MWLVLNIIELPKVISQSQIKLVEADNAFGQSHMGSNMAIMFKEILEEFSIEHKVSMSF